MADGISPDTGAGDPAQMSFEGVPRPDPAGALARGRLMRMNTAQLIATAKAAWDDVPVLEMVLSEARLRVKNNPKSKAIQVIALVGPRLNELSAITDESKPTAEPDGSADTPPSWVIDLKLTDHPRRPGGFFRVLTRLERRFECTEDEATRIHTDLLEATTRRLAQLPPVTTTHDDKKPLILEWDEDGRYTSTASVGRVERYAIDVVLLTRSDARGLKVHARKEQWFAATKEATGRAFSDLVEAMLNLLPDNAAEFP